MSVKKLKAFIGLIDAFIRLIKLDFDKVESNKLKVRTIAMKNIEFITPKIRDIVSFYLKTFLNDSNIKTHPAYIAVIKSEVLRVRELIPLPLPKKYAKQLKVKLN